jgi:hypothetical protein
MPPISYDGDLVTDYNQRILIRSLGILEPINSLATRYLCPDVNSRSP